MCYLCSCEIVAPFDFDDVRGAAGGWPPPIRAATREKARAHEVALGSSGIQHVDYSTW
jgi:hypothetical protein